MEQDRELNSGLKPLPNFPNQILITYFVNNTFTSHLYFGLCLQNSDFRKAQTSCQEKEKEASSQGVNNDYSYQLLFTFTVTLSNII